MFFHAGTDTVIMTEDIVGIFDTDNSTQNEITKKFLVDAQNSGRLIVLTDDIPKSFIVTADNKVYMCQQAAAVLKGRVNALYI